MILSKKYLFLNFESKSYLPMDQEKKIILFQFGHKGKKYFSTRIGYGLWLIGGKERQLRPTN